MSYKLPASLHPSAYGVAAGVSFVVGGSLLLAELVAEEVKALATGPIEKRFHIDLSKPIPTLEEFKSTHAKFIDLLFDKFDADHNGSVDSQEFRDGLVAFFEELVHDISYIANGALASQSKAYSLIYQRKHIPKGNVKKEIVLGMTSFDEEGKIKDLSDEIQRAEELEKLEDFLFHVFDVNHDNRISKEEACVGMRKVLLSVHNFFDDLEEKATSYKLWSGVFLLASGVCAYKHFQNA